MTFQCLVPTYNLQERGKKKRVEAKKKRKSTRINAVNTKIQAVTRLKISKYSNVQLRLIKINKLTSVLLRFRYVRVGIRICTIEDLNEYDFLNFFPFSSVCYRILMLMST